MEEQSTPNETVANVLILGSGPAGMTAAIYNARADLAPVVITGPEPGGQLMTTTTVDNWPGALNGVEGPQLMQDMIKQAEKFGAKIVSEGATKVDLSKSPFLITTDSGQVFQGKAVIIATGASARYLDVPGEKELLAHGVHTCATCDGFFYRGKKVIVVGGGDSAMEEALFLSKFADEVTIMHRTDQLRASEIMKDKAKAEPKIKWLLNSEITEFVGKGKLAKVKIKNNQDNSESEMIIDGVFLAIGHIPNTKFLQEFVTTDDKGYINTDNAPFTGIDGVFVAGDVNDWKYKQAITAAGAGCKAALEAQWYLKDNQ